jgi:hypothetical protein
MRRIFKLAFTCVIALTLLILGNPAANAFGSEVLGCAFGSSAWTAGACEGGGDQGVIYNVQFSAHNLSGTYSMQWTVKNEATLITAQCSTGSWNCIQSGCTSTSATCTIATKAQPLYSHRLSASLQLTQSGQTRTINAVATVDPYCSGGVC